MGNLLCPRGPVPYLMKMYIVEILTGEVGVRLQAAWCGML